MYKVKGTSSEENRGTCQLCLPRQIVPGTLWFVPINQILLNLISLDGSLPLLTRYTLLCPFRITSLKREPP